MVERDNVINMTGRRTLSLSTTGTTPADSTLAHSRTDPQMTSRDGRNDPDVCAPALQRLYELLDALVAWRVSFANGTDGDKALSAIGRAKVLEVRTILDTSIHNIKSAIDDIERQRPVQ